MILTSREVAAVHAFCYNAHYLVGAWRSLVARFNGVEEVVSSNLAAPTKKRRFSYGVFFMGENKYE